VWSGRLEVLPVRFAFAAPLMAQASSQPVAWAVLVVQSVPVAWRRPAV